MNELEKIISDCEASIIYRPINGEVDLNSSDFPITISPRNIVLPNSQNTDPFKWAEKSIEKLQYLKTFVLVPGSEFDLTGTRVGRGGGWYDKFLSRVPREWLRIGVLNISQLSKARLERKPWDEPMDWLLVKDDPRWTAYSCSRRSPQPKSR